MTVNAARARATKSHRSQRSAASTFDVNSSLQRSHIRPTYDFSSSRLSVKTHTWGSGGTPSGLSPATVTRQCINPYEAIKNFRANCHIVRRIHKVRSAQRLEHAPETVTPAQGLRWPFDHPNVF